MSKKQGISRENFRTADDFFDRYAHKNTVVVVEAQVTRAKTRNEVRILLLVSATLDNKLV